MSEQHSELWSQSQEREVSAAHFLNQERKKRDTLLEGKKSI